MYLKFIGIKNIGAIEELKIEPSFTKDGNPKPIVIVGENGTGKTILLSSIVDSFYEIGCELFTTIKLKDRHNRREFYKAQGTYLLRSGTKKGYVYLKYKSSCFNFPILYLDTIKMTQQEILKIDQDIKKIGDIRPGKQISNWGRNNNPIFQKEWYEQQHVYLPAYRYEEPFWKNPSFCAQTSQTEELFTQSDYKKELEIVSSTHKNRLFINDVGFNVENSLHKISPNNMLRILDELENNKVSIGKIKKDIQVLNEENKNNRNRILLKVLNTILQQIKGDDCYFSGYGRYSEARVGIGIHNEMFLDSIEHLSLGESILLNAFLNIVRHSDSVSPAGIVVIDEVDAHLHSRLQSEVLPRLIGLFPKIQFILTTHSPLFVLGMRREFGDSGFDLIEMPTGEKITAERFGEFEKAYEVLTETKKFEDDLRKQVENSHKPLVFVEGEYDIRYIEKICKLFGYEDILKQIQLCDGGGYTKLNNIWNLKSNFFQNIKNKTLLLYDCDTEVKDGKKENLVRKIIPPLKDALFDRGIENLFSKDTIEKIREENPHFIDYDSARKKIIRGIETNQAETYEINEDEKGNLCNWICENGTQKDFENFKVIIEILEEFLQDKDSNNGEPK